MHVGRMGCRRIFALVVLMIAVVGTVATSYSSGYLYASSSGPVVVLTPRSPTRTTTFSVSANAEAFAAPIEGIRFEVRSDDVPLASRGIERSPVVAEVARLSDTASGTVAFRDGRCRGRRCLGTFEVTFSLTDSRPAPIAFCWTVTASITYEGPDVPDGAQMFVGIDDRGAFSPL